MNKLLIAVFITSIIAVSVGLDCSRLVRKETEGVLNWLGNVTFLAPVATGPSGWILVLFFDQVFTGVGVWEGLVEVDGQAKWAEIRNLNATPIAAGAEHTLRFRINYGRDVPQPQLVSMRFQDIELCD